jgi:hypothetical protein
MSRAWPKTFTRPKATLSPQASSTGRVARRSKNAWKVPQSSMANNYGPMTSPQNSNVRGQKMLETSEEGNAG